MAFRVFLYLSLIVLSSYTGKSSQQIAWSVNLGKQKIQVHQNLAFGNSGDSIRFTSVKFYLGEERENGTRYHLLNPENYQPIEVSNFSSHLHLGVDSLTHEAYDYEGELSPGNGMYWAWHSGFINFKLEGVLLQGDQEFKFSYHLGGYQYPYRTDFSIEKKVKEHLTLNLLPPLQQLFSKGEFRIMSPSQSAVEAMLQIKDEMQFHD